jgi:protein-tyrosine phosphatase
MPSVLFVCTGNQFRSPIAAEVFRGQLTRHGQAAQWQVGSAGTWTYSGQRVLPEAAALARSFGLNIDGHVTHMISSQVLEYADSVIVMEEGHKESIQAEFPFARKKVHLLSQVVEGLVYNIPDPAGAGREAENIIRELIDMIRTGYESICQIAELA